MDMRYDMRMDGRRMPPRNARGEFTRRGRGRRMDRGMDYGDMRGRDYARTEMANMDMRGDYRYDRMGDMARGNYGYDGHHYPMHGGRSGGYEPVEFMGYCTGYAGAKEDYGYPMYDLRGRGGDMGYRNYDMRGRDYGYDYGYPVGDFGESLSEKELHEWCEKMKKPLSEQEKQMLSEQVIIQKAKQMGMSMDGFTEKELYVNTVRNYTDHKKSIGQNPDLALKMAYDDFHDEDGEYNGKGSEWLAVYYDNFVKVDD